VAQQVKLRWLKPASFEKRRAAYTWQTAVGEKVSEAEVHVCREHNMVDGQ